MIASVVFYLAMLCVGVVSWSRADFAVGWEFCAGLSVAIVGAAAMNDLLLRRFAREHRESIDSLNEVKRQYEEWMEETEEEEPAR